MHCTSLYNSPVGEILIAADKVGVIGVWFKGAKDYARCLEKESVAKETPIIKEAKRWLDIYFQGKEPAFTPPLHMIGTPFQIEVWNILRDIPSARRALTRKSRKKLPCGAGLKRCRRRQSARRLERTT